jgi:dTDP-4-amino-4,6-dideoxygalactose transaminase
MTVTARELGVPLCDLSAQHERLRGAIREAFDSVLRSQAFILGPQVEELECRLAEYCGARFAIGCSSGSDALLLALMALDIQPGDEVITSPYTFFATAGAIARLGAKPVFVDIRPDDFNIDASRVARAVGPRTRAIIPVHLFGQPAEMDSILEIAEKYGLAVVEDAAQAIGAEYRGQRAGSIGHIGCFSFFPSKNLGCLGDGGMCTTDDPALAARIRALRTHGALRKYHHSLLGGNFRLDTLQAAILLIKFPFLDTWNTSRRDCAATYCRLFEQAGLAETCRLPSELGGRRHVYNQFVIRVLHRDAVEHRLRENNIGCGVYYPLPLHLQDCFRDLGHLPGDFPESERAARESLALPMFPDLTVEQQEDVLAELQAALTESSYYAASE